MSQIGFVKQEQMAVMREGKEEIVKWLECHFRVAGIRPFKAKMSANKKREKDTQPDFYIYLRANVNRGDKFRDIRIGALWLKSKTFDGVDKTFMTGNLFVNFAEIPIAVWKAEPRYEGEKVEYLYDISMMKEKEQPKEEGAGYDVSYEDADEKRTIMVAEDGEEIPF